MDQQRDCTVIVERATGYWLAICRLKVFIDEKLVGALRPNRKADFPVTAGHHVVVAQIWDCYSPPMELDLRLGGRVHVTCTTNQRPLPRSAHYGFVLLLLAVIVKWINRLNHPSWQLVRDLMRVQGLIGMALLAVGMSIAAWKRHKAGAWNPRIDLSLQQDRAEIGPESAP
jgi:hypothetical protein